MSELKTNERDERINKLKELKEMGINPYPAKTERSHSTKDVLADFDNFAKEKKEIILAGRLRTMRSHGNLSFANLEDESGVIQIALTKKDTEKITDYEDIKDAYKIFTKFIDVGDFVEVTGECFVTHKGEKSILVREWKLLSKSLRPLPDKWCGLKDEEDRLRKRYLDILCNSELKDMVYKRDKFWNAIRAFLKERNFIEVETPVLENTAGGADANPFVTHHNALDMDVYLRISMGELWQKRLMVAGLEKTFEIGRQFRNEGMDAEHLQDYTQMEFYWAYADYKKGMDLVKELYRHVARETFGTLKFKIKDFEVDLGAEWKLYDYVDTIKEMTGVNVQKATMEEIEKKLAELKIKYDTKGFNLARAVDTLWKYCRKQIGGPGFLVNEPLSVSPLAKKKKDNPELVERYHVLIAGSELGNGYSELNDPIDQAERFGEQQKLRDEGDEEAQMHDSDFVEALEYGMPPTTGFGMSERVFSFFMNKTGRECQIFPLMRPKIDSSTISSKGKIKENNKVDLGINYKEASAILDEYIKDPITKLHMIETEAIMRSLAKHLGEDEESWGIIGLLHDIDWDLTKDNSSEHCVKCVKILSDKGASDFLIESIVSHVYGMDLIPAYADKKRKGNLQHCLVAAETLTGLIIASALMQPDKKLASVKLKSLKKKFKTKSFAANCNRDLIKECSNAGIELDEFLEIGLKALQDIAEEIGF